MSLRRMILRSDKPGKYFLGCARTISKWCFGFLRVTYQCQLWLLSIQYSSLAEWTSFDAAHCLYVGDRSACEGFPLALEVIVSLSQNQRRWISVWIGRRMRKLPDEIFCAHCDLQHWQIEHCVPKYYGGRCVVQACWWHPRVLWVAGWPLLSPSHFRKISLTFSRYTISRLTILRISECVASSLALL